MTPEATVSTLQPARRPKALITGGAGFIGSHLSELLLADGWEVYALDDVSTGSLENIAHLRENPNFHLVVESVLSPAVVSELVHKCDVVYHLAAAVGVRLIVEQPVHTLDDEHPRHRDGARVLRPLRQAGPHRVHVRGLRRPPRREAAARGRAAHLWPDNRSPLGVRRLEGDRRVPRARLPRRARPRLRDRAPLQHGRPSADRAVRDGHSAVCRERPCRRVARDLRRRNADPLLLPRAGLDPGAQGSHGRRRTSPGRSSTSGPRTASRSWTSRSE